MNGPGQVFFVGGNLYVLNTFGHTITEYDNLTQAGATLVSTTGIPNTVTLPLGAVVDVDGDVYVSGNQSGNIIALNINGGQIENLTQDNQGLPFGTLMDAPLATKRSLEVGVVHCWEAWAVRMFSSLRIASRLYSSIALEYFCRQDSMGSAGP